MPIIICPGIHPPELTERFVQDLQAAITEEYFILPTERYTPYSAIAVYQWLEQLPVNQTASLTFIAFSAGVVGGFGAAIAWQLQGGRVASFIAYDGWGMPLFANFPIYRVSHDYFTHWSSSLLGAGAAGFYAEPEVEHLDLWRSPSNISGWQAISIGCKTPISLNDYLAQILAKSQTSTALRK